MFVSDVHLGSKHSQAAALLEMLHQFEPESLYLVGDFIDGWKLRRRWRWAPTYDQIFERLLALKQLGTQLYYMPGNHDNFLRKFVADFGIVDLQDQFVHQAADGRRYLVIHGDQFDRVEQQVQWLSIVGTHAYDVLLSTNYLMNWARGKRYNRYAFCGMVKRRVKSLVRRVSNFELQLVGAAQALGCEGIIYGHVHSPRIYQTAEIACCNTGDWVENCTALLELEDGSFELRRSDGRVVGQLEARPRGDDGNDWQHPPFPCPSEPGRQSHEVLVS